MVVPRVNCELELRLNVRPLIAGCIYKSKHGHVSGIPAVHGLMTNLALGVAALLKRQMGGLHLIFGPAIGTFEDGHHFTLRLWVSMHNARSGHRR
jgi:hypothetical protein